MEDNTGRFLKQCLGTAVTLAILLACFNVLMDPYLIFNRSRVEGLNALKPGVLDEQYLVKAYDVFHPAPSTLVLGSSGVTIGINAHSSAWLEKDRPVYNLGMLGGGTFAAYRYLQHVTSRVPVRLVVVGLDLWEFMGRPQQDTQQYESRLAVTRDGDNNQALPRQNALDLAFASLSFDAAQASALTLLANIGGDSSDIEGGTVSFLPFRELNTRFGPNSSIVLSDIGYALLYKNSTISDQAFRDIRAIVSLCQRKKIRLILVIEPAQADDLELMDLSGKWPALETWKRQMTALIADSAASDSPSPELWDFYGYDDYSTASVGAKWFLTPTHYTEALGDVIIRRISGGGDESFGVRLTPVSIDARLSETRTAQQAYREREPSDALRVRKVYFQATGETPELIREPTHHSGAKRPSFER